MAAEHIEISIKGRRVNVPALAVGGNRIIARGKWLKIASIHDEAWLEAELDDPEACVRELKSKETGGPRADIFTFSQKPTSVQPKYQYYREMDSVAAVSLSTFKQWWESLPQEGRKNVRRSQKRGVTVKVMEFGEDLLKGIMGVNNDSPVRQNTPNVHYGKSLDQTRIDHSAFVDRSDFICAVCDDEMIGYAKVVYRGQVASILNFVPKSSQTDKRPANALMAKIVEACEEKGVSCLTYGFYNYGNKRESSLREFKTRNGFEEILVPRYYVPLTLWGSLGLKMGIHRGLLGILPHRAIVFGIGLRAKWYDLKSFISRCSSMAEQSNSNRQTECSNPPAGSNT